LETDKLVIWVDPLDGTMNFVTGDLMGVTTLIGVAYEGRPIFGVIHYPFAAA
jgi:3'(2'), 5'-bisphosphate nucleotidase